MTDKEARQILLENRPDRPHSTKNRQLQAAIDRVIPVIEARIAEDEFNETMLDALDAEDKEKYPTVEDAMRSYQKGYEEARRDFERPKSHWIRTYMGKPCVRCAECGLHFDIYIRGNFCMNCGADMRGDTNDK